LPAGQARAGYRFAFFPARIECTDDTAMPNRRLMALPRFGRATSSTTTTTTASAARR
jgi:hypothetical protein